MPSRPSLTGRDGAVAPFGGNSFNGTFTLTGGGTLTSIGVRLADDGQTWAGDCPVVPEPTAAVMLLPGMLPIGLAFLRRRRSARGPGSENDGQVT